MKQVVQNPKTGSLELTEVPAPVPEAGQVLVRNHYSVVSPGTEKLALDFARMSLAGKARRRPDLVRQVVRKLRQEGPLQTYRTVMDRLDAPQPLGYASAGTVEAAGDEVTAFAPGDRVACAGAGYANHAEWVVVPENLVAPVPDTLALDKAAFATLGAIALQGLRVAGPSLGEIAVVVGLGLIGQLSVQLLLANGCRVLALDLAEARVKQALDLGAEWGARPGDDHEAWKNAATDGHGADLAVVTAASDSSAPIQLAAELCRMKARIAAVGATGMQLDRRLFYEKELELRMSMSYGPGRYDRRYEELGLDYPLPYVRWTENRNLRAFLALAASGAVDPGRLDVAHVDFSEAVERYDALARGERGALAMTFRYDAAGRAEHSVELTPRAEKRRGEVGIAFIGAGNYARAALLPAVERCPSIRRRHVVTSTGASSQRTAAKFGYASCGTEPGAAFGDPDVDLVFVATRHDSHSALAGEALRAGKAVWLEKPMALGSEELDALLATARETGGFLAVGYNRRFSRHASAVKQAFATRRGPMAIRYTVAAGPPPRGSWLLDPVAGGGRVVGEACHFVDLCAYLVGAPPTSIFARTLGRNPETDDSTLLVLGHPDGSTAVIEYLANAGRELPKERWEVSADGQTAACENFRLTRLPGGKSVKSVNQDKGQESAIRAVVDAVRRGEPSPWGLEELASISRATLLAVGSAATGTTASIAVNRTPEQSP